MASPSPSLRLHHGWIGKGYLGISSRFRATDSEQVSHSSKSINDGPSFSHQWPRWTFTVISVMPNLAAICLFMSPRRRVSSPPARARSESRTGFAALKRPSAIASFLIPFERPDHGIQDILVTERLCQEVDGSSFHCLDRHRMSP